MALLKGALRAIPFGLYSNNNSNQNFSTSLSSTLDSNNNSMAPNVMIADVCNRRGKNVPILPILKSLQTSEQSTSSSTSDTTSEQTTELPVFKLTTEEIESKKQKNLHRGCEAQVKSNIESENSPKSSPGISPCSSPGRSPSSSPRLRRSPLRESKEIKLIETDAHINLNQYTLLSNIGKGSSSKVQLALNNEDGKHYAVKILSKKKLLKSAGWFGRSGPRRTISPVEKAYREIAILKKVDHPNVVKLVEILDDPNKDGLYLVFELLEKGEVLQIPTTNPLSEDRAWNYFRDVVLGLEYLHYQKIIHRDIKPQNLLLGDDDHVQIADLGVCTEFEGSDAKLCQTSATPAFTAPETLDPMIKSYSGKAVDVWSLGCTLYAFVYGDLPFGSTDSNIIDTYNKIKSEPVNFPEMPVISELLKDLLNQLFQKDPAQRITLPQIKEHNWVTRNGTEPLPTEEENCILVEVSDEDIENVVKSVPKLDTLILVKKMIRNHSFQHPFTNIDNFSVTRDSQRSLSAPSESSSLPQSTEKSPIDSISIKEKEEQTKSTGL